MKIILVFAILAASIISGCIGGRQCPDTSNPVCGSDGVTYKNACFAGNAGVGVKSNGSCMAEVCSDSDGGKDIFTSGQVSDNRGVYNDQCAGPAIVDERFCDGILAGAESFPCPDGYECDSGKCMKAACSDSDGGIKEDMKGIVTAGGKSLSDECVNQQTVKEYYCDKGNVSFKEIVCTQGNACVNGTCAKVLCTDSDGGKDRFTKGTVAYGSSSQTDSCFSGTKVLEYFCVSENSMQSEKIACDSDEECVNGACKAIDCVKNVTIIDDQNERYQISSLDDSESYGFPAYAVMEINNGMFLEVEADSTDITNVTLSLRLYRDYESFKDGDEICTEFINDGDSKNDLCGENTGNVQHRGYSVIPNFYITLERFYFTEYFSQEGTITDWTDNSQCPDDDEKFDNFEADFYPYLGWPYIDPNLGGKKIMLFGRPAEIKEVNQTSVMLEIDGHDEELEDGDEFEYKSHDYTVQLEFESNSGLLTRMVIKPA